MTTPLTEQQAAPILGVKPGTLRKWRWRPPQSGAPPYYRVGRRVLYDKQELKLWQEKQIVRVAS